MNWLYYLLEANLYLAAFYVMYKLLLQNSTFYNSNRYFLIVSIIAAFTLPLVQLGFLKPEVIFDTDVETYNIPLERIEIGTVAEAHTLTTQDYILYGYLVFSLLLSLKLITSISKIIKVYVKSKKKELHGYTMVELTTAHTAFSFFNILFIHPDMAENKAVLRHEIIHIQQKHSWDILLLEFLKISCWFNPVIYLIKKDVTLLHEYIADAKTTSTTISKHAYAMLLIENSMASYSPSIVNQFFNQSILKSRINMLNKEKTANWARLKYLLAVPLGAGLLCVSTLGFSKSYGYVNLFPRENKLTTNSILQTDKGKTFYPKIEYSMSKAKTNVLDKRYIVINGDALSDARKFYGVSNAETITYLNAADATKKYGDKGKHGAVEITGNDLKYLEFTPPSLPKMPPSTKKAQLPPPPIETPPMGKKLPPPPIEAPPVGKKLKKFPSVVKPDQKVQAVGLNERKVLEVEVVPQSNQKEIIVKGYKKPEKTNLDILKKEIEVAELNLVEKNKVQEVEVVPIQKVKHMVLNDKPELNKEVIVKGYKSSEKNPVQKAEVLKISPLKKVQSLKITPKDTLNKTGAIKKANSDHTKTTTTKSAIEKTNHVFNKAWTLYKPKVEENKDDRC